MPMNHQITYLLQDIFNLVPDLSTVSFVKSINVNTNDQMLVIYAASLIRSIIALHNLINNKLTNKEAERKEAGGTSSKDSAVKKDTEKEKSEKSDKNKDSKDSDKGEKSKSDKK
jgi:26S proteasome regulatory subunit N8